MVKVYKALKQKPKVKLQKNPLILIIIQLNSNIGKYKVTLHQATKARWGSRGTLPLMMTLDGGGSAQRYAWVALPSGNDPVPTVYENVWVPRPVLTGAENLANTGIRSPDRPARRESLYRPRYPGPQQRKILTSNYVGTSILPEQLRSLSVAT